jgi:hypothetical protein
MDLGEKESGRDTSEQVMASVAALTTPSLTDNEARIHYVDREGKRKSNVKARVTLCHLEYQTSQLGKSPKDSLDDLDGFGARPDCRFVLS